VAFERIDDITRADVAFKISAGSPGALFVEAGAALWAAMLEDMGPSSGAPPMRFELQAESIEALLHLFLDELLYHKDAEGLIVVPFAAEVELGAADAIVRCDALAERIDPAVHRFVVDVKAVTMHRFSVRREGGIWTATVVFDV